MNPAWYIILLRSVAILNLYLKKCVSDCTGIEIRLWIFITYISFINRLVKACILYKSIVFVKLNCIIFVKKLRHWQMKILDCSSVHVHKECCNKSMHDCMTSWHHLFVYRVSHTWLQRLAPGFVRLGLLGQQPEIPTRATSSRNNDETKMKMLSLRGKFKIKEVLFKKIENL